MGPRRGARGGRGRGGIDLQPLRGRLCGRGIVGESQFPDRCGHAPCRSNAARDGGILRAGLRAGSRALRDVPLSNARAVSSGVATKIKRAIPPPRCAPRRRGRLLCTRTTESAMLGGRAHRGAQPPVPGRGNHRRRLRQPLARGSALWFAGGAGPLHGAAALPSPGRPRLCYSSHQERGSEPSRAPPLAGRGCAGFGVSGTPGGSPNGTSGRCPGLRRVALWW